MSAGNTPPDPLQRAYTELRKPDWPPLEELRQAHLHFVAVQGLARSWAQRAALFNQPIHHAAPPPLPARIAPVPPPLRRNAGAFDPRAAAAGEYVHPEQD